jgi:uncharacterized RDD family membrane protein YckC
LAQLENVVGSSNGHRRVKIAKRIAVNVNKDDCFLGNLPGLLSINYSMVALTPSTASLKYKTNLAKRIIASLLDYLLVTIPVIIYILYFGHFNKEGGKTVEGIMVLPIPLFWFLYFVVVEAVWGSTFAHQAFNLKVVTVNRKEIEWEHALKRHLLDPIDIYFAGVTAIIAILNSEKHQRLGDLWANTIVVDIKDPEQYIPKAVGKPDCNEFLMNT